MGKARVTRELAWKIRQMYQEVDERGGRRWTMMGLAAHFGVSETTVYRAVNNYGAYGIRPLPEVKPEADVEAEAKASLQRFLQQHADLVPGSAAEKMAQAATEAAQKAKAGDTMLNELKKGEDGKG